MPNRRINSIEQIAASLRNGSQGSLVRVPDTCIRVVRGADDAASGANLLAAYAAAKLLTPGGAAISATNRVGVLLPRGGYKLASTLTLDTDGIDLIAEHPEMGGDRLDSDADLKNAGTSLDEFRPPATYVYSEVDGVTVVEQAADDVRMRGFGIAQLSPTKNEGEFHGLLISASDNTPSRYAAMYFWHRFPYPIGELRNPVWGSINLGGQWRSCVSNAGGWRVGTDGIMSAKMYDMQSGAYAYGGDAANATFDNCLLEKCVARGTHDDDTLLTSGAGAFGGCNYFGIPSTSTCLFIDCLAGERSFSLGKPALAEYRRCRGGALSFGGTAGGFSSGEFSGYAEDCYGEEGSFGGSNNPGEGKLTGELVRCSSEDSDEPWRCEGATIRDSRLTVAGTDKDCLHLLDDNTVILDSDLIANGTGNSIASDSGGTARAVLASHCRMNKRVSDDIANSITDEMPIDLRTLVKHGTGWSFPQALSPAANGTNLGLSTSRASAGLLGTEVNGGGGTASASETAGIRWLVPKDYYGGSLKIRIRSKFTASPEASASVGVDAQVLTDGSEGSDLVSTDAYDKTELSTSFQGLDFKIAPATVAPSATINSLLTMAIDDTGGTTDCQMQASAVSVLYGGGNNVLDSDLS